VFTSSLFAVQKKRSRLGFTPKKKILVVLIDGLGAENLLARAGHAPFLANQVAAGGFGYASYPATTSANITSFATGLTPGEHGIVGHVVRDAFFEHRMNLLNGWSHETDPLQWQPHQTVSEQAAAAGVNCNVIAAEEYRDTGFTHATMRQATFYGADSLEARFQKATQLLHSNEESINYLYIPELDKFGHLNGWSSPGWALELEAVAGHIDRLIAALPADCGVVITADHGMVDSPEERKIELSEELADFGVDLFGGDTRSGYLYLLDPSQRPGVLQKLSGHFALNAHDVDDLIEANWYGEIGLQAGYRLPDLVLLAKSDFTLFHKDFSKPRSYRMVAHHGAATTAELKVPLVRIGL
jgi:predicted AlkP superfamily pyrophosphatase or phosphodiesterase